MDLAKDEALPAPRALETAPTDPYQQAEEESVENYYDEVAERIGPVVEVVGDGWIDDHWFG
jgi:hypothetical protein